MSNVDNFSLYRYLKEIQTFIFRSICNNILIFHVMKMTFLTNSCSYPLAVFSKWIIINCVLKYIPHEIEKLNQPIFRDFYRKIENLFGRNFSDNLLYFNYLTICNSPVTYGFSKLSTLYKN